MTLAEVPDHIEGMRNAFLHCCIDKGYGLHVCETSTNHVFGNENKTHSSVGVCSKLVTARKEHVRVAELLQRQAQGTTSQSHTSMDETVNRKKLGFGPPQKDFACTDNWEYALEGSIEEKTVQGCQRECELNPACTAISYFRRTCVQCDSPTMHFRKEWTSYIKQGTTRRSQARCRFDRDCEYLGCNVFGEEGWRAHCFRKDDNDAEGKCVNVNMLSILCEDRDDDEVPLPGQWCDDLHLHRLCPPRPHSEHHERKEEQDHGRDDDEDNVRDDDDDEDDSRHFSH